jgi:hypothetical protein
MLGHSGIIATASSSGGTGRVPTVTPGTSATAFLARTSGLSGAMQDIYSNILNACDTSGISAALDTLQWYGTTDPTLPLLNLLDTRFTQTANGGMTFTPREGYTGDGTSGYINTLADINATTFYKYHAGTLGCYVVSGANVGGSFLGESGPNTDYTYIQPTNSTQMGFDFHGSTFTSISDSVQCGNYAINRTTDTEVSLIHNESVVSTVPDNVVIDFNSGAPSYVFARNDNGSPSNPNAFSTAKMCAYYMGALTNAQIQTLQGILNAAATALAINTY